MTAAADRKRDKQLAHLRAALSEAHRENRRLRMRLSKMTDSRDHWRQEAKLWKWGALR